jgi:hypothetical protein
VTYPRQAVREGDSRADVVGAVQERLVALGYSPLAVDGAFGRQTKAAVKLFQTRRGLETDGIVGPVTWAALFSEPPIFVTKPANALLAAVLDVARSQVGVRETGGPNRGPEVEKYLASLGLAAGNSYCMAFIFWCFAEACVRRSERNPLVKTGRVLDHWSLAPATVKIAAEMVMDDLTLVQPGAIFMIDHGEGRGHCGFVHEVRPFGVGTIEGNTSAGGGRNGDGVYQRTRRYSEISLGFLDYSRTL